MAQTPVDGYYRMQAFFNRVFQHFLNIRRAQISPARVSVYIVIVIEQRSIENQQDPRIDQKREKPPADCGFQRIQAVRVRETESDPALKNCVQLIYPYFKAARDHAIVSFLLQNTDIFKFEIFLRDTFKRKKTSRGKQDYSRSGNKRQLWQFFNSV